MRKLIFLVVRCFPILSVFVVSSLFSQAPQMFKYQTIVRDSLGNLLVNKQIAVKVSILQGSSNGASVYSEVDNPTTNKYGLVNLEIGNGGNQTGKFDSINWGNNTYFIQVDVDIKNGINFKTLGTSQLLSVPYALYANKAGSMPIMTDAQRDTIQNPKQGMMILNKTTNCLNIYNGKNWFQNCSDSTNCVPKPTTANAGTNQVNVTGTSTTLSGNTPLAGTGLWTIQSGTGGNIQSPSSPTSAFTGIAGNSYVLRWTISTPCGSSYADVTISFIFPNCGNVTDNDGNVYNTVIIGIQCWMQQNLATTTYNDGTAIPNVTDNWTWSGLGTGAYCWYNDSIQYKNPYGALYNWYAVNTGKLCPAGWHVPDITEWTTLINYLGGSNIAGGAMKSTSSLWNSPNTGATNSSGFTALPGSNRDLNEADIGSFRNLGFGSPWWSAKEYDSGEAWVCDLFCDDPIAHLFYEGWWGDGFSVRCVKN